MAPMSWLRRGVCVIALCAAAAGQARADDTPPPATIDLTYGLKDGSGKAIPDDLSMTAEDHKSDPKCSKCEDLTLGRALALALRYSTVTDREINVDGMRPGNAMQKALREMLANRFEHETQMPLSGNQLAMVKKALNVTPLNGATTLAILEIIDPAGVAEAAKAEALK